MRIIMLVICLLTLSGCVSYDTMDPDIEYQSAAEYKFSVCGGSGWVLGQGTEYSKCLDKALAKWYVHHAQN